MDTKDTKSTRTLKWIIAGTILFAAFAFVFGAGVWVGQERARYSFAWAENYHKNFGGPQRGVFNNFPYNDFTNSHGIFGSLISIDGATLIIKGQDGVEKTIVTSAQTTVVDRSKKIKIANLKTGDALVVIGSPDTTGSIDAKLIRVLPAGAFPAE